MSVDEFRTPFYLAPRRRRQLLHRRGFCGVIPEPTGANAAHSPVMARLRRLLPRQSCQPVEHRRHVVDFHHRDVVDRSRQPKPHQVRLAPQHEPVSLLLEEHGGLDCLQLAGSPVVPQVSEHEAVGLLLSHDAAGVEDDEQVVDVFGIGHGNLLVLW